MAKKAAEALELVWVHPSALMGHPDNVRTHPPEQLASIRESVAAYGWVEPFVVNRHNGLLVNGHGRLEVAIQDGHDKVPALYGTWTEAQHADLLGVLDAIGAQARVDLEKFAALRDKMSLAPGSALGQLQTSIANDPFFRRGAVAAAVLTGHLPSVPTPLALEAQASDPPPPPDQEWEQAIDRVPSGPRSPFRSMTFTLTVDQAALVDEALAAAKVAGPFGETGNDNSNGNALERICEAYV